VKSTPAPLPAFERTLARAMLAGVWLSAACLSIALALLFVSGRSAEGDRLLRAGLLILMATPILRVVLSVAEAIRQRDWFWLATTVAVTLILTVTVVYSLHLI
jgi:uncharacterized membrane protein